MRLLTPLLFSTWLIYSTFVSSRCISEPDGLTASAFKAFVPGGILVALIMHMPTPSSQFALGQAPYVSATMSLASAMK